MANTVKPSQIVTEHVGQPIRLTWVQAANGRNAVVQGTLESVTHDTHGTSLVVDLGFTYLSVPSLDVRAAEVIDFVD